MLFRSLPGESSPYAMNRRTAVDLTLAPREACFVVITDTPEALPSYQPTLSKEKGINLSHAWDVNFDKSLGGIGTLVLDSLIDWTSHTDSRVKYYSGTAVYRKEIKLNPRKKQVVLDLNPSGFVARVKVNGKEAGIVWCSPWQLDITDYVVKGKNYLEIEVANSLMNRMIYDASLPDSERVTYEIGRAHV